jgi:hypothetical protein
VPSVSKSQQEAAGIALAVKQGKLPMSKLMGASKTMYHGMNEKQLGEFASTPRKGLPARKK